jgi:restriction system protein
MARNKKARNSPAGRARELATGIGLLTISFLLFAVWPLMLPGKPVQVASIAFVLAGLLATGVAWRRALHVQRDQNAAGKRLEELQALSPDAFEEWVGARFHEQGFAVEIAGAQGDHGIDLVVSRVGERAIVQCKNYRAWSVGEPVLRDLFGAMHAAGADRAYLVTTGRLTSPARVWAEGKPIEVWDGAALARQVVASPLAPQPAAAGAADVAASRCCMRCGAPLVERTNRRSGERFLGCSRFPACRETAPAGLSRL